MLKKLIMMLLGPFLEVIDDTQRPLFYLDKKRYISVQQAFSAIFIMGSAGSGKSSTSCRLAANGIFQNGLGSIFLTARVEDTKNYIRWAVEAGRRDDLIIVEAESYNYRYNFLDDLSKNSQGMGLTENLVDLFININNITERNSGNSNGDPYWKLALKQCLRAIIDILSISDLPLTVENMIKLLRDVTKLKELSPEAREESNLVTLLKEIECNKIHGNSDRYRFTVSKDFLLEEFARLPEKTSACIVSMFTSMGDIFLRPPLRNLLSTDTNFTPNQCYTENKIIILALPVETYKFTGVVFQNILKLIWQQKMLARNTELYPAPVAFMADEFQNFFVEKFDKEYMGIARGKKIINIFATQNLPTLYSLFPGETGKHNVDSILGNCAIKLLHNSNCPVSKKWNAELMDKHFVWKKTLNEGENNTYSPGRKEGAASYGNQKGMSVSQKEEYRVFPREFSQLRTGGAQHDRFVDVILHHSEDRYSDIKRITFRQEKR